MKRTFAISCAILAGLALACSEGDSRVRTSNASDAGVDGSIASDDAGHTEHDPSAVDSGPPPIRCTSEEFAANDFTDGGALVVRFLKGANPLQYENNCARVKVGATVTFTGSFKQHPLEPAGGDEPNPIPPTSADQPGDELAVVMPKAGVFGYQCTFHPANMFGAIEVVP